MKKSISIKKIGFLATGDEIVNGDVLNTNAQTMARMLFEKGITIGSHLTVSDDQSDIEKGIRYLLQENDSVIITGGLGPTSDDRTRFALSDALKKPLCFDESTWETIQARFQRFGLKNQPESNRHQAFFPEHAHIIPNELGTAAGCWLVVDHKPIFMLPGPPTECLPMFHSVVLPTLIKHGFQRSIIQKKWLLFGVSEGQIAEKLDAIAKPLHITTGYRLHHPYVEAKIRSEDQDAIAQFCKQAQPLLDKHLINQDSVPASELLIHFLSQSPDTISIEDFATHQALEKTLHTMATCKKIHFGPKRENDLLHIEIHGLDEMWAKKTDVTHMTLTIKTDNSTQTYQVPYRGERSVLYAIELISREILNLL